MKNLYSTYILGFLFVENLVRWLFVINKRHCLTEDIRPIIYLLITVLEGHGRVSVRDLIKYALSRKVVCEDGKRNLYKKTVSLLGTMHVNARPSF